MTENIVSKNDTSNTAGYTSDPPVAAVNVTEPILPEWIRLPKSGTLCAWTGLSRAKLNELILPNSANDFKPPVRSICLRKRGATRGTRLILRESLMNYLRDHLKKGMM